MKDKKGKIRKNQNVLRNKVKINENLASGNALDIGRQYLMQGMSHTALEIWQTYIFHMFLFKRIQHLNTFIMYDKKRKERYISCQGNCTTGLSLFLGLEVVPVHAM